MAHAKPQNRPNHSLIKNTNKMQKPLFSVHSIAALESRSFSVLRANIENTPEKLEIARNLYPSSNYYFEFHFTPISLGVIYGA